MTSLLFAVLIAALPPPPLPSATFLAEAEAEEGSFSSARLVTPDEAPLTAGQALVFSTSACVLSVGASAYGLYLRENSPLGGTALLAAGLVLLQVGPSLAHLINEDQPSFFLFTGIQTFFAVGALVALGPFGPVFAGMFGVMWLGSLFFNFLEIGDSADDWAGRENAKRRRAALEFGPGGIAYRF